MPLPCTQTKETPIPKFKKKPLVIEATQWFKNGDHPKDDRGTFTDPVDGQPFLGEGKIVRYFRHPYVSGELVCDHCKITMHHHGWIDNHEGGYTVCPGDWVITGIEGEIYPCKPNIFDISYEPVSGDQS